ncbi:MAG TPA: CPBP family glutamic-type intramembrane protease, partial [Pseudonocardiaceae bacterium]
MGSYGFPRPHESSVLPAAPPRARELSLVPVHRGYLDALGLFTVAFGAYAILSIGTCLHLLGGPDLPGIYGWNPNAISVTTGSLWIAAVVSGHDQRTVARRAIVGLAIITAGLAGWNVHSTAWPDELWDVLAVIVCVGLFLLLAHHRGVEPRGLGIAPRWAANRIGRRQVVSVAIISAAGQYASAYAGYFIATSLPWLPEGGSKASTVHGLTLAVHMTAASIIEETVLVAGVVTALEAARRPAWQIYALYLAMRLSFHLYYGSRVVEVMIFAAVNLWLFRRTRRLTPLIIAHIVYDTSAAFGGGSAAPAIYLVGFYSLIALTISALVV